MGDSKKGLAHILERRTQQYGEQQALESIHDLPRIVQEAKFYKELENKIKLVTPTDVVVWGKRGRITSLFSQVLETEEARRDLQRWRARRPETMRALRVSRCQSNQRPMMFSYPTRTILAQPLKQAP